MSTYQTITETEVRFSSRVYPVGTKVQVLSGLVHDGVALVRFPEGEETYLAAYRMEQPPQRATAAAIRASFDAPTMWGEEN
jgi:hypothetical protein